MKKRVLRKRRKKIKEEIENREKINKLKDIALNMEERSTLLSQESAFASYASEYDNQYQEELSDARAYFMGLNNNNNYPHMFEKEGLKHIWNRKHLFNK